MGRQSGDAVDTGGSDGGVRVPEPACDVGEHLQEVGRECVSMGLRENGQEVHALFPHRRLVGGVGGVDTGKEHREGVGFQRPSDGLELGDGDGVGVSVRELGEARENPVLEILRHRGRRGERHCVCVLPLKRVGFSRVGWLCRQYPRQHCRSSFGGCRWVVLGLVGWDFAF